MPTDIEIKTGGVLAPEVLGQRGTFTIDELNPAGNKTPRSFTALMITTPIVTAGYAGWSRVARPRRMALTEWVGRDALSVGFDFLLDGFADGHDFVEDSCRDLEGLAGVDAGDPEPPLLRLGSTPAALMPHGYHRASHNKWFIEALSWNADLVRYNRDGDRIRAGGSITLTVYSEDERLKSAAAKDRADKRGAKGSKRKTYKVRAGDTLSKIAARSDVYGDAKQWKRIAKANSIRDPKKLKVGRTLKIP